ncbi:MAG: hypothetical protein FD130_1906, partial [Halothiobacillaceae bacterium]
MATTRLAQARRQSAAKAVKMTEEMVNLIEPQLREEWSASVGIRLVIG